MHSDARLTSFSSFSLGKANKFSLRSLGRRLTLFSSFSLGKISLLLLRSLVRQFAGSSSVPAHVEMMGFLGIGNNPMVGATVAVAVDVAQGFEK